MGDGVPSADITMAEHQSPPPPPVPSSEEPKYGGFTRFEIELEVLASLCLSHPFPLVAPKH